MTDSVLCSGGHPNAPGSRFCGICGMSLDVGGPPPSGLTDPPPPPLEDAAPVPPPPRSEPGPASSWIASHRTPSEGIDVRTEPAPQLSPVTHLPGGTPVRVEEWLGAWARVTITSGWGGWLDGRRLVDADAPTAAMAAAPPQPQTAWTAPSPAGGSRSRRLAPGTATALVGAGGSVAALFLPWLGSGAAGVASFDIPFAYLWLMNPQASSFSVGAAAAIAAGLAAAALLGVIARLLPARIGAGAVSLGGALFAAMLFAFGLQTIRFGSSLGIPISDVLTDVIGLGAWIALGGSVLVGIGARVAGGIR